MRRFLCLLILALFSAVSAAAADLPSGSIVRDVFPEYDASSGNTIVVQRQQGVVSKVSESASLEVFDASTGETKPADAKVSETLPADLHLISDTKQLADNASFNGNSIVSAAFSGRFYIEADNRECGVRVDCPNHTLKSGVRADIVGVLKTDPTSGERYIDASSAVENGSGSVLPLAMNNPVLGGGDWFYTDPGTAGQKGVAGGIGLNNIGLLVRTTGFVTYSAPGVFYIDDGSALDDGSGHKGIKVIPYDSTIPLMESYVSVTGISSCTGSDTRPQRLLKASASDSVQTIKDPSSTTWFSDMNGVNNADSIPAWASALHNLSVGWIRVWPDFSWQTIEPQQNQWSFSATDQMVTALQSSGFKLLPILAYTADWAVGPYGWMGAAANVADWEDYVRTTVSRYIAPPYNIKYWQVWNEPTTTAWFAGASNQEFIDKIYIPAARIIRELGGYVVFGGWPSNNTIANYEAILNYNNAWTYTDYADIHYFNAKWMQTLYNNWVANGKLKGVWQTEVGWKLNPGYVPSLYPRVLRFQLDKNSTSPDMIKLFWYASWSTGTDVGKSFLEGDWNSPVVSSPNGTRLKVMADLFAGAPVHLRTDVTLTASTVISFQMDETKSSYEAFTVGNKTIVAAHIRDNIGVTQFTLAWPSASSPTRVRRISSTGTEQDLTFSSSNGVVSVTVPLSGLTREDAYSNVYYYNAYVVADP